MVVVKDKQGLTEYIEDKKMIISTYKGRVDKDMSFVHLSKVIDFYKNNEVKAAIIDLRELYGSFASVMDYLGTSFYPVAAKSGLRAQAFVVTNDLIIKNLAQKLKLVTSNFNVEARIFASRKEAEIWINSVK